MKKFPIQTALSLLMLIVLLVLTRMAAPALKLPPLQLPTAGEVRTIVDFPVEQTLVSPLVHHADPAPPMPVIVPGSRAQALLDDESPALDHFYAALWRSEKKERGAVTRILHYGDSPTTADLITGDVRTTLQARYGDAGHGFVLIGKPWAWYQHTGLQVSGSGWKMSRASNSELHDGLYGLGGVSFAADEAATSRIVYATPGHRHFEIWYLKQPGGGTLEVSGDGAPLGRVDTSAAASTPGVTSFLAAGSVHTLDLQVSTAPVRVFGVVAEKNTPGVVYDTLGLNGASIHVLSTIMNGDFWCDQLRRRHPDLVIVNYGTNEADFASFIDHGYEKELREAIRRIRTALPDASIMLMSPMDRGHREGDGIVTMPTIPHLAEIQRRVAHDTGCAFFDTFHAMGGEGTMARWYEGQPRLVSADLIHPTPQGAKMIAVVFARELAAGLNRYKLRQITSTK